MIELEAFLPYRLMRIAAALSARTQATYRQHFDLTVPAWRVLVSLAAEGGLTARELGRRTAMHKTKVSRAVRALEDRRWLGRATNPVNRREEFLSLTALGRRSYEEVVPSVERFERQLRGQLSGDGARLLEAIDELERALAHDTSPPPSAEAQTRAATPGPAPPRTP